MPDTRPSRAQGHCLFICTYAPFSPSIIYLKADRGATSVYIQFNIPIETGRLEPCSDRTPDPRNVHFFFFYRGILPSKLFIAFCNSSGNRIDVEHHPLDRWSLLWFVGKKPETNFSKTRSWSVPRWLLGFQRFVLSKAISVVIRLPQWGNIIHPY